MKKLTNAEMEQAIAIRTAKKLNMRIKKVSAKKIPKVDDAVYLLEWLLASILVSKSIKEGKLAYPSNNELYDGAVIFQAILFRKWYIEANCLTDDEFNNSDYRISLCGLLDAFINRLDLSIFFRELSNHTDLQKFLDYSILYFREEM